MVREARPREPRPSSKQACWAQGAAGLVPVMQRYHCPTGHHLAQLANSDDNLNETQTRFPASPAPQKQIEREADTSLLRAPGGVLHVPLPPSL